MSSTVKAVHATSNEVNIGESGERILSDRAKLERERFRINPQVCWEMQNLETRSHYWDLNYSRHIIRERITTVEFDFKLKDGIIRGYNNRRIWFQA